ncbi:MAG TPA: DarT ssDNA thymidine ADP-ribosyltransferase family protein [Planctomycetota bacterium]|nr:DarT ssDNA thymidine ADP-ribosyltransferase family protein [Planctomycetota bacterium]
MSDPDRADRAARAAQRERLNALRREVVDRGIRSLTHFTSLGNVRTIRSFGILSRKRSKGLPCDVTDASRSESDHVSLSITFPDDKTFLTARRTHPDRAWAVVLVRTSVLWRRPCLFSSGHASDASMTDPVEATSYNDLASFRAMFETEHTDRPKDARAEVLVLDTVPRELIQRICVECESDRQLAERQYGIQIGDLAVMPFLFQPRFERKARS